MIVEKNLYNMHSGSPEFNMTWLYLLVFIILFFVLLLTIILIFKCVTSFDTRISLRDLEDHFYIRRKYQKSKDREFCSRTSLRRNSQ